MCQVIAKAAKKVLDTRGPEVEARRAAQQAKRAERAPKPGTPEQRGRGSGRASKSHHGRDEGPPSASKRREGTQKDAPAGQEPDASERRSHQPSREEREQVPERDRAMPSKAAEGRAADAPRRAATPAKQRTPAPAEKAKPGAADAVEQEAQLCASTPPVRESAAKAERDAEGSAPAQMAQPGPRPNAEAQPRSSKDAEGEWHKDRAAAAAKGPKETAHNRGPKQNKRWFKHVLADEGNEDTGTPSGAASEEDYGGPPGGIPPQKRQRLQKTASLDNLQATPAASEDGVSVTVADAAPKQAQKIAAADGGRAEQQQDARQGAQRKRTAKEAGSRLKPQPKGKAGAKSGRGRTASKGGKRRTSSREASEWEGESEDELAEKSVRKIGATQEEQEEDVVDEELQEEEQEKARRRQQVWL